MKVKENDTKQSLRRDDTGDSFEYTKPCKPVHTILFWHDHESRLRE